MSALDAVRRRTSWSRVTEDAPSREQLLPLVEAAGRVADHSSLRPWRLIELRGDDRLALGAALAEADGDDKPSTKPLRASLLIAIVVSYRKSDKVPEWEQEAVASGVAHTLSLLLDEAGWGVIWRTGGLTRSEPVARVHGLSADEALLGWLYVGGKPEGREPGHRKPVDAEGLLTAMPRTDGDTVPPGGSDADRQAERERKRAKKERKREKKRLKKERKREKKAQKRQG